MPEKFYVYEHASPELMQKNATVMQELLFGKTSIKQKGVSFSISLVSGAWSFFNYERLISGKMGAPLIKNPDAVLQYAKKWILDANRRIN